MAYQYDLDNPVDGEWQNRWGMKFKWTSKHLSPQQLEPLIHSYDTVATEAVERLDELVPPSSTSSLPENGNVKETEADIPVEEKKKSRRDLYELTREYALKDEKIGRLWAEVNTVPEWVDWDQVERGQKVFFRYGAPAVTTLLFLSLLGGMGSARTVETLDRTGGFDARVVRRRLLETTQHTLNVHRDVRSIKPGGSGWVDSVRVRLLHAAVRRRVLGMAAQHQGYYDVARFGVPINDLDSVGTINTFSSTLLWMGLPRQGVIPRPQEVRDYLALWRYVAYLMGTPHDWMATPESARAMMESLLISEIRPSPSSAILANNIITGLHDHPPTFTSRQFMCAQTYWLNGQELANKLEIERPGLYYHALVLGHCAFFMASCYINRSFSWLDNRNINLMRRILYIAFLEDKSKGALGYETKFVFKYIPAFDKISTERGSNVNARATKKKPRTGVGRAGIERVALVSLVFFSALTVLGLWYSYKVLAWALS